MDGKPPPLCACFGLSETFLRMFAITHGVASVEELGRLTKAGTGCRSCAPDLERLLADVWRDAMPGPRPRTPEVLVREALAPYLARPDWELQIIDVEGAAVRIRALPLRAGAQDREETLRTCVQNRLQECWRPDAVAIFV